jgi:ribonuclease HII
MDFGSGYPSDPLTIKFLKDNLEKHRGSGIIRKSWKTVKNLEKQEKNLSQKKLLNF